MDGGEVRDGTSALPLGDAAFELSSVHVNLTDTVVANACAELVSLATSDRDVADPLAVTFDENGLSKWEVKIVPLDDEKVRSKAEHVAATPPDSWTRTVTVY